MNHLSKNARVLNVFLSVVFILFAYVQLNDPDPVLWFTIYFLVAVGLIVSIFVRLPLWALYLASAGLILFAAYHFTYFFQWLNSENRGDLFGEMQGDKYFIEGTREFLGLLIALSAVVYLVRQNRQNPAF